MWLKYDSLPAAYDVASGGYGTARMPWTRKLSSPIFLKDTRILATLGDARQFVLDLSDRNRCNAHWKLIELLLLDASRKQSALVDAEAKLRTSLGAEGWLTLDESKKDPADKPAGSQHASPAGA
jgi:hypothetical protein